MSPLGPVAKAVQAADNLTGGVIPGLPGAPVRTPLHPTGASTGPELWPAMAGRLLTRQMWVELYGLPGYDLTLRGGRASGVAATPRDFRPIEGGQGRALLGGRFLLAGTALDVEAGGDPWNRPSPSRAFAVELHAFTWLPALMNEGEAGAREALRLTLAWADVFSRWSPFAWGPDILARRAFNLSCAARKMAQVAEEPQRERLLASLGVQGRQLLRPPGGKASQAERLVAAALVGAVLAGSPGDRIRKAALGRLGRALDQAVQADGAHASRAPEMGLELLLDLLTLDDGLSQRSEPTPQPVTGAIERLTRGLRVLALPDGRLASVQGGGPSTAARVAAARAHDSAETAAGEVGGVARIQSPLVTLIADVAAPARGAWSSAACAQPASIEIVCGRDRLITSSGWTPRAVSSRTR